MTTIDSSIEAYPTVHGLSVALVEGVLSITMNRPDSLNALTEAMMTGIADAVERAGSDERVRVVRLGGAGRGFSSGAGISEEDQNSCGGSSATKIINEANRAVRSIAALPKPAVAVVHGPAAGVAASLALVCDVVLASEKAFFMLAFTKIALMPDGGASALVAAAVGRIRAMRMALLAERIPAREAFDWGLVTAVYPDDTFDAEVDKVLATLVSGPAVALRKTKEAINAATLTGLEGAFEREMVGQSALIRSHDFKEGTLAFQQRRSPTFTDT
jgi:enoyl-CoA hydratase